MTRGVIQDFVQDEFGNIAIGATVEVRLAEDSSLAVIYDSITGGAQIANPTTTDADGLYKFYAEVENYNLIITAGATNYTLSAVPAINADELSSIAENAQQVAADAQQVSADKAEVESDRQEVAANTAQVALDAASAAQSAANAQVAAEAGGVDHIEVDFATANANVGTYANGDTVLVLSDENYDNAKTYYEVVGGALSFIGLANALDTTAYPQLAQNKSLNYWAEGGLLRDGRLIDIQPSLDFDFGARSQRINQAEVSALNYTREGTATYFDADGLLKTAKDNAPQYEYDPETGEGYLLLEPARTNLLTYSEQFDNAAWVKFNATVTANDAIAPDGTNTADRVDATAVGGGILQDVAFTTAVISATDAVYVKQGIGNKVSLDIDFRAGGDIERLRGEFNFDTEEFLPTIGTADNLDVKDVGGGWYRLAVTDTTASGLTTIRVQITLENNGDQVYIWGAQLEEGAYPTSYIPTLDSAVTRAAPSATVPVDDWFNPNSFTVYVEGRLVSAGSHLLDATTFARRVSVRVTGDGQFIKAFIKGDAGEIDITLLSNPDLTKDYKISFSYQNGIVNYAIDGVGGSVNANIGKVDLQGLRFGRNFDGTATEAVEFSDFVFHPKALNEDQLKALTAHGLPNRSSELTQIGGITRTNEEWLKLLAVNTDPLELPTPSLVISPKDGDYKLEGESDSFGNIVTYTRTGDATKYHASGKLGTVGTDTPQFEYDPETGERSLLLEPSRTNLLRYSEQFDNAAWVKLNVTVTPNVEVAPDGLSTADKITEDTNTGAHVVFQSASGLNGLTHTCSFFAKASERQYIQNRFSDIGSTSGSRGYATFDLLNSTVNFGGVDADVYADIEPVVNGWNRCTMTVTLSANGDATSGFDLYISDNPSAVSARPEYTGDGVSGLFIWGAQLEEGSYPTSYIPTVASAVTRAAPSATVPAGDWQRPDEITVIGEVGIPVQSNDFYNFVDIGYDTGIRGVSAFYSSATGNFFINVNHLVDGSSMRLQTNISIGTDEKFKYALVIENNTVNLYINGVKGDNPHSFNTATAGPTDGMDIARNSYFKRTYLVVYPKALNEAQLKALTSGGQ